MQKIKKVWLLKINDYSLGSLHNNFALVNFLLNPVLACQFSFNPSCTGRYSITLFVILLLGTMRPRVNIFHDNNVVKLVQFAALVIHMCLNNMLS